MINEPKSEHASATVSSPETTNARCLNCATVLEGQYCSHCGQRSSARIISLWALLCEFTSDLLNLDSRLWRSLLPLLIRPGFLTGEYLRGRRVRYFPPLRLYLILSLIFFLLNNLGADNGIKVSAQTASAEKSAKPAITKSKESGEQVAEPAAPEAGENKSNLDFELNGLSAEDLLGTQRAKRLELILQQNPQQLADAFINNLPVMVLLLLPVIALIMQLLYVRTGRYYVEHLLFFVHYHASTFLLLSLSALVMLVSNRTQTAQPAAEILHTAMYLWVLVYLYLAMRHVYGKRLLRLRYLLLVSAYSVGLVLLLVVTAVYTVFVL